MAQEVPDWKEVPLVRETAADPDRQRAELAKATAQGMRKMLQLRVFDEAKGAGKGDGKHKGGAAPRT